MARSNYRQRIEPLKTRKSEARLRADEAQDARLFRDKNNHPRLLHQRSYRLA